MQSPTLFDIVPVKPTNEEQPSPPTREERFLNFLHESHGNIVWAAQQAGYSTQYTRHGLIRKLGSAKFLDKYKNDVRTLELLSSIPQILDIEQECLDYLRGRPEEVPKFAGILKQKKMAAGILRDENVIQSTTISIDKVGQMMLNVYQDKCLTGDLGKNDNGNTAQHTEIIDIGSNG